MAVDVVLQYFDDCPNWQIARERLRTALEQVGHGDDQIRLEEVATEDEARQRRFTGSPTIRIDGVDPFDDPLAEPGMACRVYPSARGFEGAPTIEALVIALERASGKTS